MKKKTATFVIVGVIVGLLAGVLNGQSPVEIRAASTSVVTGWLQMSSPAGDPLWVAPDVRLTSADFARAEARTLADGGPAVALVLNESGTKKMADLSAAQPNKPIALIVDGKVIWAPVVRGAIGKEALLTGGPGGLTKAQIDRLLASFKK
jgi:preprotein translocase subunit SecD